MGDLGTPGGPWKKGRCCREDKALPPQPHGTRHSTLRSFLTQRREGGEEKMKKGDKEPVDHLLWAGHHAELEENV